MESARLSADHLLRWAGAWPAGANKMKFDERNVGDYRIYAGALEAPLGDGYIAAMIVQRVQGVPGAPREALRDESLACGHRWESAADALAYAMTKAQEAIRNRSPMLAC
jgi:hypothetical protein